MAQAKRTGQFGDIFLVTDVATPITAEPCVAITALPGDDTVYPAATFYQITAAGHRLLDPDTPIVVKDTAVALSASLYTIHYGSGIIEFYAARTGTPSITVDGAYLATTGALTRAGSCKDWLFTLTSSDVDVSEYGTGFGAHIPGMTDGTFEFSKFQTDLALYEKMRQGKRLVLIFYENVKAPAYWVLFARPLVYPVGAPVAGAVEGKITGRLLQWPDFRNDVIG